MRLRRRVLGRPRPMCRRRRRWRRRRRRRGGRIGCARVPGGRRRGRVAPCVRRRWIHRSGNVACAARRRARRLRRRIGRRGRRIRRRHLCRRRRRVRRRWIHRSGNVTGAARRRARRLRRRIGRRGCRIRRRSLCRRRRRVRRRRRRIGRRRRRRRLDGAADVTDGRRLGRRRRCGRGGDRRRQRRQERQRVEVPLRVRGHAHAHVQIRHVELGCPARTDRPDLRPLADSCPLGNLDRAEMRKRDRVAVGRGDRHRLAARRHRAREAHRPGRGRADRRPRRCADVDAAVLPARVRMARVEDEAEQHGPLHGPRPCVGAWSPEQEEHGGEDERATHGASSVVWIANDGGGKLATSSDVVKTAYREPR